MRPDIRSRILSAAKDVFSRKGYRATTVADILEEADVARGTFYRYYPNKRQAFYDLMSGLFNGIYEASRTMSGNGDGQRATFIQDSFAQCYRLFIYNRGLLITYFQEALALDTGLYALWDDFDRKMTKLFAGILTEGAGKGEFREVDNDLVSRAMMMLFLQVPYRDLMFEGTHNIDVEAMAGEMANLVLDGVSARDSYS